MTPYIIVAHYAIFIAVIAVYVVIIGRLVWLKKHRLPLPEFDENLVILEQTALAILIACGAFLAYKGEPAGIRLEYHAYYYFAPAIVALATINNIIRYREKQKYNNRLAEGRMLARIGLPLAIGNLAVIVALLLFIIFFPWQ